MLPSCLSLFLNLPAHKRTVTCKCPDVVLSSLLLATTVCRLLGGQTKTASAICSPTNICYSKFNIVVNHIFDLYFCCMHLLVNKLFVFVFVFVLGFPDIYWLVLQQAVIEPQLGIKRDLFYPDSGLFSQQIFK